MISNITGNGRQRSESEKDRTDECYQIKETRGRATEWSHLFFPADLSIINIRQDGGGGSVRDA